MSKAIFQYGVKTALVMETQYACDVHTGGEQDKDGLSHII